MEQTPSHPIIAAVKSHPGLVVLHGFNDNTPGQFWLLDMTGPELEAWWAERESFWWAVTEEIQEFYRICGDEPEPLRAPMVLPGRFLSDDSEEHLEFWCSLSASHRHYYCQICCENDSFLKTPDGRLILHQNHMDRNHDRADCLPRWPTPSRVLPRVRHPHYSIPAARSGRPQNRGNYRSNMPPNQ